MSDSPDDRFLARWSRRKALSREGIVAPEPAPAPAVPVVAVPVAESPAQAAPAPPPSPAEAPPTLDDVAALAPGADIRRFVAAGVDAGVRNAALKKLFADPHFNVMDGLDTYIDDYNRPSVVPAAMLRRLMQAHLRAPAGDSGPDSTPTPPSPAPLHEDPDLRLQPHDGAGSPGADPGAGADAGREH